MYAPVPSEFRRLTDLDEARAEASAAQLTEALRRAARPLRDQIGRSGTVSGVRTFDNATFPYPTRYALDGAAASPAPFVMMCNRMQVVQTECDGRVITVLINPTDSERSLRAPFFAGMIDRYGSFLTQRLLSKRHGTAAEHLASVGLRPDDVDYITFDHLHVQDLRGLLGTSEPEPGRDGPTEPLFPNARLLAHREELRTLEALHPLQRSWYVEGAILGVEPDRMIALDGDYLIGAGLALIHTPGHTRGNHTPVVVTDRGLWTISENGISTECYAPECSDIPGLRKHARDNGVEVILNANTRELTLEQYASMVLEKSLADPCPDRPEFPQHFASSALVASVLAPGLSPSFALGKISYGDISRSASSRAA